ncbi:hypothetical protein K435DRAFT_968632 [Dendrothele bispora CBS 962.96]|uniref:Protein kinase domain-containing protein n=1 Tax=Dendrothele bispora (strain CBS 962.96) TaxID=1314807 RepID=A0A4S8LNA8_DENBC|nr:hypothetical protein K435DRAFT_968632 [Dendrothele bispora CBS 962.96]
MSTTNLSKPPPKPLASPLSSSPSPSPHTSSSESTATISSQGSSVASTISSPSSSSTAVPKISSRLNPSSSTPIASPPSGSPSGSVSRTRGRGHSISAVSSSRESSMASSVLSRGVASSTNLPSSTSAGTLLSPPLSPALSQTFTIRPGDVDERVSVSSSFRLRSRSRSKTPGVLEDIKGPITPTSLSSWWKTEETTHPRPWKESPKRQNTVPEEQTQGWDVTRERVAQATASVLGTAGLIAHEGLLLSVDLLELAPVPGLRSAASVLLTIWDALQVVDDNRLQCLRLTEHCADILLSVRQEVWEAGDMVGDELALPIVKLTESFNICLAFLQKQGHRPFLKRYLKRDEILKQLGACNAALQEALGMFSLSIQIRILKQVQETQAMMREMMERDRAASLASIHTITYVGENGVIASRTIESGSSNALQLSGVSTPRSGVLPQDPGRAGMQVTNPQQRPKFPYDARPLAGMILGGAVSATGSSPSSSRPSLSIENLGSPSSQASSSSVTTPTSGSSITVQNKLGVIPAPPTVTSPSGASTKASIDDEQQVPFEDPLSPVVSAPFTSTSPFDPQPHRTSLETQSERTPTIASSQLPNSAAGNVMSILSSLRHEQAELDAAADLADMRNRMRAALSTGSDLEIMQALGVRRDEMPEAIKTLQRALEHILEQDGVEDVGAVQENVPGAGEGNGDVGIEASAEDGGARTTSPRPKFPRSSSRKTLSNMARRFSMQAGSNGNLDDVREDVVANGNGSPTVGSVLEEGVGKKEKGKKRMSLSGLTRSKTVSTIGTQKSAHSERSSQSGHSSRGTGSASGPSSSGMSKDTLDREFIEMGIDAMRRMSRTTGKNLNLPSWTITRYEVELDEKVGIGFFSDVYKGTWRQRTVAVKVLAETTPRKLFVREMGIWKTLVHPNVLELYGASSASGDPPWFFVSPYLKNGSLTEFLRRVVERGVPPGLMMGTGYDGGRSRTGSLPSWPGGGLGSLVGKDREAVASAVGANIGLGLGLGMTAGTSSSNTVSNSSQRSISGVFGRGRSGSGSSIISGEIAKEWDLLRFMHEIAKGMEYLHSNGVLHGDLKAANILVDDRIHCVISDFGQSEMKSEAYRISGTPPPHGTLRWQAPELMDGASQFTVEMDVYAFSICCIEILSMGRMPWPLVDDDTVRHFVLHEDSRPHIPQSRFATQNMQDLLRSCWAVDPFHRPTFSKVAHDLKLMRKTAGANSEDIQSPRIPGWEEHELSHQQRFSKPSPDMHPVPLPGSSPQDISSGHLSTSPQSSDAASFRTARDLSQSPTFPSLFPHREETVTTSRIQKPEPVTYTPSDTSSDTSSIFTSTPSSSGDEGRNHLLEYDGYDSPPPANEMIAEQRNERRYRLLLQHEFHPSLTLPLWSPSPVELGAVGYLSKPRGSFVTLFNAFIPEKSKNLEVKALPSVYGYGKLSTSSQRQDKRNAALRGLDAIAGLLTFKSRGDGSVSQSVSRRYTFALRSGHKTAQLCTETTVYRYVEQLDAPKKWFKTHVDAILETFGSQHHITKEDLFLVIGTLDTPDHGLFVSHNHPDGQVHFNVFTAARTGQPWGTFTTDTEFPSVLGGPSYHEPVSGSPSSASKVSLEGGPWNTVLVARLRFKPDVLEPTST